MGGSCLIRRSYKRQIEDLALILGEQDKEFENHKLQYEDMAYHCLVCNNGMPMRCTPDGGYSLLFTILLDKYLQDPNSVHPERDATRAKCLIYTQMFANQHGRWVGQTDPVTGSSVNEPSIADYMSVFGDDLGIVKDTAALYSNWEGIVNYTQLLATDYVIFNPGGIVEREGKFASDVLADRDRAVNEQMDRDHVPVEERTQRRYEYEYQWNKELIDKHINNICKILGKQFDIAVDDDGNVEDIDQYDFEYDDDTYKHKFPKKATRALILKHIKDMSQDPSLAKRVLKLLQACTLNKVESVICVDSLLDTFIDIVRDTDEIKEVLNLYTNNSHNSSKVTEALDLLKRDLRQLAGYFKYRKGELVQHKAKTILKAVGVGTISGIQIVWGLLKKLLAMFIPAIQTDTELYWNTYLIKAQLMNRILVALVHCENLDNILTQFLTSNDIQFLMAASQGGVDSMSKMIEAFREIINKQIKALESRSNLALRNTRQFELNTLNELKLRIESALSSSGDAKFTAVDNFLIKYFESVQRQYNEINQFLENCKKLNGDSLLRNVDIRRLDYYINNVLTSNISIIDSIVGDDKYLSNVFRSEDSSNRTTRTYLIDTANRLKNSMLIQKNGLLDIVKNVMHERARVYLDETVGRTTNPIAKKLMLENLYSWIDSEVQLGDLSWMDKNALPAKYSASPLVRMIHNRITQMIQSYERETNKYGATLEALRAAQRKNVIGQIGKLNLFNQFKKYAERRKDGSFSGNFISDIRYGDYEYEYDLEIERLRKKYGYVRDKDTGMYVPPTEEAWFGFESEKLAFTGNGKIVKDSTTGEYKFVENISEDGKWHPRAHQPFLPLYYLDKMLILGQEASRRLSEIDKEIHKVYKLCYRTITYTETVNGETVERSRSIPYVPDLGEEGLRKLNELEALKLEFSSTRVIQFDADGKISGVLQKSGKELELAERFRKWKKKQRQYFKKVDVNSLSRALLELKYIEDYAIYDAVTKPLRKKIEAAPEFSDERKQLQRELDLFEQHYAPIKLNPLITDRFRSTIVEDDADLEKDVEEYLLLKSTLNTLISLITEAASTEEGVVPFRNLKKLTTSAWKDITEIEKRIDKLESSSAAVSNYIESHRDDTNSDDWKLYFKYSDVPYRPRGSKSYYKEVERLYGKDVAKVMRYVPIGSSNSVYSRLLTEKDIVETSQSVRLLKRYLGLRGVDEENATDEEILLARYVHVPKGSIRKSESTMLDTEFDEENSEHYQVDKYTYDNSKKYNEIKDDKFYKELLKLMDYGWSCYDGLNRGWRYRMPQRRATDMDLRSRGLVDSIRWNRGIKTSIKSAAGIAVELLKSPFVFTSRDIDVERVDFVTDPSNRVVESIPVPYTEKIDDPNMIDLDLVSSVVDFVSEALRYKFRNQLEAEINLAITHLSKENNVDGLGLIERIRNEARQFIYGRTETGFGKNGRLVGVDKILAPLSKKARGLMHARLMGHNWLSVLKNAQDSMCNLITAVFTGKFLHPECLIRGLVYMGTNLFSLFTGANRSKAMSKTQALMLFVNANGNLHERFRNQYKWIFSRHLQKFSTLEFEVVDYSAKAAITETIFDSYRLVWNPITQKPDFMTLQQCQYAYMQNVSDYVIDSDENGIVTGTRVWENASTTLRDAYVYDSKTGLVDIVSDVKDMYKRRHKLFGKKDKPKFKYKKGDEIIAILNPSEIRDIIRPKSALAIGGEESNLLETQVRNTIHQLSSVVNGMLEDEDKSSLETNYVGALVTAFRGWMITQYGEFHKNGNDFCKFTKEGLYGKSYLLNSQTIQSVVNFVFNQRATYDKLVNPHYRGSYEFSTGTIGTGYHTGLFRAFGGSMNKQSNPLSYIARRMLTIAYFELLLLGDVLSTIRPISKRLQPKMVKDALSLGYTLDDMYKIKNHLSSVHSMLLTAAVAMWACSMFYDDDENWWESLLYAAAVASIVERLPQLGPASFYLSASELLTSVTVFKSVTDKIPNSLNLVFKLLTTFDDNYYGEAISDNSSYSGHTEFDRDVIETIGILGPIFGVPFDVIFSGLDVYNLAAQKYGLEEVRNIPVPFTDLHLYTDEEEPLWQKYQVNMRKNLESAPNVRRVGYYKNIFPVGLIDWSFRQVGGENSRVIKRSTDEN